MKPPHHSMSIDSDYGSPRLTFLSLVQLLYTAILSAQGVTMPAKTGSRRRYGKAAGKSVKRAMHKYKSGTLKSGTGSHPRAKSRKQAIAIGLSEAREKGAKVPRKRSSR